MYNSGRSRTCLDEELEESICKFYVSLLKTEAQHRNLFHRWGESSLTVVFRERRFYQIMITVTISALMGPIFLMF